MVTEDDRNRLHAPRVRPWHRTKLGPAYLLTATAAVVVLFGVIVLGIPVIRDASSRKATRMRFLQLAVSLAHYSEFRGHLPYPARRESADQATERNWANGTGRPLYSWRVEIWPFLMSWHGSWDQSQHWNHPANRELVELSFFYAYDATGPDGHPESFPETNALAITGPGTAFGDGKEPPRGLKDIPPSTILVVETRASGIPWPAPGDFDIQTMPQTINAPDGTGISSRHAGGFHLVFADGQVWFLSDKVPYETLKKFFTTAEAKKHDREKLLGPFALHRAPR